MSGTAHVDHDADGTSGSRQPVDRERGAGLVEYVLLMALIALVCISAVTFFGKNIGGNVSNSGSCLGAADGSTPTGSCLK